MSDQNSLLKIIKTTEKIISEKGCKKTTLNDIIKRSGLSKGAIYHYVQSKNELFALVLKHQLEEVDRQFIASTKEDKNNKKLGKPLRTSMRSFEHSKGSVSNQIFFYLLSNQSSSIDEEILNQFQEINMQQSIKWIEAGKKAGKIPEHLDAEKVSNFLVVLGYGTRVQAMINEQEPLLTSDEIFSIMKHMLSNPMFHHEK